MRFKRQPTQCCHPGCTVQGRFPLEDGSWVCTQHLIQRTRKSQDAELEALRAVEEKKMSTDWCPDWRGHK